MEGQILCQFIVDASFARGDVDDEAILPYLRQAVFAKVAGGDGIKNVVKAGDMFRKLCQGEGLVAFCLREGELGGISRGDEDLGAQSAKAIRNQASAAAKAENQAAALMQQGILVGECLQNGALCRGDGVKKGQGFVFHKVMTVDGALFTVATEFLRKNSAKDLLLFPKAPLELRNGNLEASLAV